MATNQITPTSQPVIFYTFLVRNSPIRMSEQQITTVLTNLSNVDKTKHWICSDLTLKPSSKLGRFFWFIAQYFSCIRESCYGIDHQKAHDLLQAMKHVFDRSSNKAFSKMLEQASSRFASIVSPEYHINRSTINQNGMQIQVSKYSIDYLLDFYRGTGCDCKGRTLQDIWSLSNHWRTGPSKESGHDFIQWLFPIQEPSRFNPSCPVLSNQEILTLRADPQVMTNLQKSFTNILEFWGLTYDPVQKKVLKDMGRGPFNFANQFPNWNYPNHNHDRMSRLVQCLFLFGMRDEAIAFHNCLMELDEEFPNAFSRVTVEKHWKPNFLKFSNLQIT